MNILSLIKGAVGGSKMVSKASNLLVGENSKKRQIGFCGFSGSILLYKLGLIDDILFDSLMLLWISFIGVAFSAKLTKIGKQLKGSK